MRIVVALGGNALARRGEPITAELMAANLRQVVTSLAHLAAEHEVIITHGNGPQVGLLALQNLAYDQVDPYPLDNLVAQSQGMIGYPLQRELRNALAGSRDIIAVLTTVTVDECDPAFASPTKFVGPMYTEEEAQRMTATYGWTIRRDGKGYRRVVPSPLPRGILEADAIRTLVEQGKVVIGVGGGGIPVTVDSGSEVGVEAVVDKDLASAVLAQKVGADVLLILTDVSHVIDGWGSNSPREIVEGSPEAFQDLSFAAGSMGPKVQAACTFAASGRPAFIGALNQMEEILAGKAGTRVSQDAPSSLVYAELE